MFIKIHHILAGLALFVGIIAIAPSAQAATTTVCGLGCDFTTLDAAVNAPHVTPDTIVVQVGYTFTFPPEGTFFNLPDDLTITCDSGVIIGDVLQTNIFFNMGNRNTIRDCTFEAANFDASGKTDVAWLRNTFSADGQANITLTNTDGFTLSDNVGIQHVQIQNADNGTINGNTLDCYNGTSCLTLETAGGGPFDYSNPTDVPNDIVINDNVITNRYPASNGDVVYFGAGVNIDYTSNTLQYVLANDNYITMLTVRNASVDLRGNFFIFPEKIPGANNQTWGINLRVGEADIDLNIENNSFIRPVNTGSSDGISCLGIYDSGTTPGLKTINLNFTHNLCYDVNDSSIGSNRGLTFGYAATSSLVNLTEEYNGFYNVDSNSIIQDQNGPHNSRDVTDIIKDPIFRTENASPADDFEPAPMSWYFDINGTEDIGAVGGVRETIYTIDDNCVVDYSSCHSQFSATISSAVKSGDTINVAAGNYAGLAIEGPLTGITLTGAGNTTIFDGALNFQSALSLEQVTSSQFSNVRLINSTDTSVITYPATLPILSFGGNNYDDSDVFGGPAGGAYFVPDLACNAELITADGDVVTIDGVSNINAGLADVGGSYVTLLFHDLVADNLVDAQNNLCGGVVPFTHFIEDMFVANGDGTYTYNPTNLSNQGITIAAGMTFPPSIGQTIAHGYFAGLRLNNSSNNHFTAITIDNNDLGVSFIYGSASNTLETLIITNSTNHDIISSTSGTNDLLDPSFTRTTSEIQEGTVRVRYRSIVEVTDPLFNPLQGVLVDFVSQNGLTNVSATTDVTGVTPIVDSIAYLMTTSSLSLTNGGYNLFTITANATGTYATTSTPALLDGVSIFQVIMPLAPVVVPVPPTSGGGGLPSVNGNGTYSFFNTTQSTGMVADSRMHQLVKLKDDGNAKTQEDSTVYYIGADGLRHAFPNPDVYGSWYCDFSQVKIIGAGDLANYRLGSNVTYRPGLRLVKFPTNPNVYVVQAGHTLRAIKDEAAAIALFGTNWAKQVSDIQDTFYNDYSFGEEVTAVTDKAFLDLSPSYPSGEMGITGYQDITIPGSSTKCSSVPTAPTTPTAAGSWPFATIPKTFSFNADLNSTSGASNDVRYLQEFLASKGKTIYADGRVTGTYGDLTTQAVKNYQKSKGISQTGTVGPITRSAINKELNALR